jgi:hypothetical protein
MMQVKILINLKAGFGSFTDSRQNTLGLGPVQILIGPDFNM